MALGESVSQPIFIPDASLHEISDPAISSQIDSGRQRSLESFLRIPTPLHNPEKFWLRFTTPADLFDQMNPLLRQLGFFEYCSNSDMQERFKDPKEAVKILREAFPNALVYLEARGKALDAWKEVKGMDPDYIEWWKDVSITNGKRLFREQWDLAYRHYRIQQFADSRPIPLLQDDYPYPSKPTSKSRRGLVKNPLPFAPNTDSVEWGNESDSHEVWDPGIFVQDTGDILTQWGFGD